MNTNEQEKPRRIPPHLRAGTSAKTKMRITKQKQRIARLQALIADAEATVSELEAELAARQEFERSNAA